MDNHKLIKICCLKSIYCNIFVRKIQGIKNKLWKNISMSNFKAHKQLIAYSCKWSPVLCTQIWWSKHTVLILINMNSNNMNYNLRSCIQNFQLNLFVVSSELIIVYLSDIPIHVDCLNSPSCSPVTHTKGSGHIHCHPNIQQQGRWFFFFF